MRGADKSDRTFPKGIRPKLNEIELEFVSACCDVVLQRISNNTTDILLNCSINIKSSLESYPDHPHLFWHGYPVRGMYSAYSKPH